MTNTAEKTSSKRSSAAVLSSRCQQLGAMRRLPQRRRGPKEDGAALAAEELAGSEEGSEDRSA